MFKVGFSEIDSGELVIIKINNNIGGVLIINGKWIGRNNCLFGVIATKYENITRVPLI